MAQVDDTIEQHRQYNPLIEPDLSNPFPFYRWARHEQPVSYSPILGAWVVARYDDVRAILHDPQRFSSVGAIPRPGVEAVPGLQEILAEGIPPGRIDVDADPPEHSILRAVSNKALNGPRVRGLRPRIRALADALIDEFIADGSAELVWQFADRLSSSVIATALGVPREDFSRTRAWNDDFLMVMLPGLEPADRLAAAQRFVAYQRYIVRLIDDRRRTPRDDMLTDAVRFDRLPGTPLPLEDLVQFFIGNYLAAIHTTRNAISSTVLTMLRDRSHWTSACDDPNCIPAIVEESLRRDAPHRGLYRITTEEVTVGNVTMPAGARLYLLFGSANRDAEQFDEPDTFCPRRPNIRSHLAFGQGIHLCAGAHLARTEAHIAIRALTERIPQLDLAPHYSPSYEAQVIFYGLDRLDVIW